MTAVRRLSVPGLALLLAAATAAADVASIPRESAAIRVLDTLAANASPAAMAAKCRDMKAVLRECGRRNDTVFDLFRDVEKEQKALRRIWPEIETYSAIYVTVAGLVGCGVGSLIAFVSNPCGASPAGTVIGCVVGSLSGAAIGASRGVKLHANHRDRVNDLVRRVNGAVAPRL